MKKEIFERAQKINSQILKKESVLKNVDNVLKTENISIYCVGKEGERFCLAYGNDAKVFLIEIEELLHKEIIKLKKYFEDL